MIVSGLIDKKFIVQSATLISDGSGGKASSWIDVGTLWGFLQPLDYLSLKRNGADATHQITTRYRGDIVTGMRLVLESKTFMVRDIRQQDKRKDILEFWVVETEELG